MINPLFLAGLLVSFLLSDGLFAVLNAAPHRYDHVVIVVEENRTEAQIIGDRVNAPYINTLADGGVVLDTMYGVTHPSQPNYMHLFSGDNQGVTDDNLPKNFSTTPTSTYPFTTPNLGAEIITAGFTFAGFSEQLEAAGTTNDWADFDPHTATYPNVAYRRKHNPWANWVAKLSPVPANQLTSTVNRAFIDFPANFANLPTVSLVVPNQQHDMHDGSRKMGDDWLSANLSVYAKWAKTNNSLLIITWDEDDYNAVNQIPTVFYGAGLRNGTVAPGTWTHHNMLRTLEDMYGTTHAGSAAQVRPIVGPFTDDPAVNVQSFRQGLGGYTGALDTQLWQETPSTAYGTNQELVADLDTSTVIAGNQVGEAMVRFNSLFGPAGGQIPTNATIESAKLLLFTPLNGTNTSYESADVFRLHRMIVDWNDTATWDSLGGGVSTDNIEAASTATFSLIPVVDGAPAIFDVTTDIELFRAGTPNRGWLIRPSSSGTGNGWTFNSSEYAPDQTKRPTLEIVYSLPNTPYNAWAGSNNLTGANAAPAADPDHDGVSNLLEFAYNLNPKVADAFPVLPNGTAGLPAAHYLTTSGGVLEIQFLRRKGTTAAGLTYTAQFTDALGNAWVNGQAPVVTSINADWERVTVRDSVAGPNPHRFGKVVVGLQ
jgi:hypothetical protein